MSVSLLLLQQMLHLNVGSETTGHLGPPHLEGMTLTVPLVGRTGSQVCSLKVKQSKRATMMTNTVHPEFAFKASVERSRRRFLPPLLNASLLIREGQYFSWESWPENKVDEVTFFFCFVLFKATETANNGGTIYATSDLV